jgi:hypothetical protein
MIKQWTFEVVDTDGTVYQRTMDVIIVNGVEVGTNETPYLIIT